MKGYVVGPGPSQGANYAKQSERHEQVDWAESQERPVRHERMNEESGNRRRGHQREVYVAKSTMKGRTLSTEKDLVGPKQKSGQDRRDVHTNGERSLKKRR